MEVVERPPGVDEGPPPGFGNDELENVPPPVPAEMVEKPWTCSTIA